MTRFSIYGYYGLGNTGDEAILAALIDGVKHAIPKCTIGVYSARPQQTTNNHQINSYCHFGLDMKGILVGIFGRNRVNYLRSVTNFLRSDVIIIGGGGLFFDTPETNEWFFGYIDLIHRAKRMGKKVALVGISIGPLYHQDSRDAISKSFILVDLISVRDCASKALLIECGISSDKIHVIPDLVFTLKSAEHSRLDKIVETEGLISKNNKKNIALTPCCYNSRKSGWEEQYVAFCEKAVNVLDSNVWLIPMQRNNSHDDFSAIEGIYMKLSDAAKCRTNILKKIYSAKEIQGILGRADFVLAERLHGTIMALNNMTPFMSIAYMLKVEGVLESANLSCNIIKFENFLDGSYLEETLNKFNTNADEWEVLRFSSESIKDTAARNFQLIKDLL